jgi:hypothetical protein
LSRTGGRALWDQRPGARVSSYAAQ